MISLAVSCGGRGVGMGSKVMEFCSSIVRALWHDLSPASWMLPNRRYCFGQGAVCTSVHTLDDVLCLEYFCGPSRGRPYDTRGSRLKDVLGRLLYENRLGEEDLRGLREEKMESIRSFAQFLRDDAA